MIVALSLATCVALLGAPQQSDGPMRTDTLPPQLAEARDAVPAGRVEHAIQLATQYTRDHPDDERGFLVLGDAYMARAVTGRYAAWKAYRRAGELNPRDPAAPYGQAMAGWYLGPPDGERLAREGFERVLAIDPLYRNAWERWSRLYRDDKGRRHLVSVLNKHTDVPAVTRWIAQLELELGNESEAASIAEDGLRRNPTDPVLLALAAQRAFDEQDWPTGWKDYQAALAHADQDSTDFLWQQAMPIASPAEIQAWNAGIRPDQKPGWLQSFWERRNPDLFSQINQRVAEHFSRLRYVREHFDALAHPLGRRIRSPAYRRALNGVDLSERREYVDCEATSFTTRQSFADLGIVTEIPQDTAYAYMVPPGFDLADLKSGVAMEDYERVSREGAQGVAYLRFGPPTVVLLGAPYGYKPECAHILPSDLERWEYPWGELRFVRDPRGGNDMVLRPMSSAQMRAAQHLLWRDASTVPLDLEFGVWTVEFRDTLNADRTAVLVVTTRGSVAAELIGAIGGSTGVIQSTSSRAELRQAPGEYVLLANAVVVEQDGKRLLGRHETNITVRDLRGLSMSDLLLVPSWPDTAPVRAEALAHVLANLAFTTQDTIRAYSELYGLATERGRARYQATYDVLKTDHPAEDAAKVDWSGGSAFTFTRTAVPTAEGIVPEVLDLAPSMVGQGTFLLRLRVKDLVANRDVGEATSQFTVR